MLCFSYGWKSSYFGMDRNKYISIFMSLGWHLWMNQNTFLHLSNNNKHIFDRKCSSKWYVGKAREIEKEKKFKCIWNLFYMLNFSFVFSFVRKCVESNEMRQTYFS